MKGVFIFSSNDVLFFDVDEDMCKHMTKLTADPDFPVTVYLL